MRGPKTTSAKEAAEKEEKIRKSLRYSIIDGAFYSAMVGFGESFFSAFAVFLQATTAQLGLLGSLPQTLGSILELFSTKLIRLFKSRKRLVLVGALLNGLMYIPVALTFFFGELRVYHLIFFACLYWIFGMLIIPAWSSWMGDLVGESHRGSYFGRRNRIAGFVSFIAFLIGGYVLQHYADGAMTQYIGFASIFGLAFASRMVSLFYISKKYEPEYASVKEADFNFIEFLKQARFRNYGLFVLFFSAMNMSVYIAGPFFTPYMLQELRFNYMEFTVIMAIALIVKYLAMPAWGRAADSYGTRKALTLASFMMPLVPLLWVFSTKLWYLVLVQIYSGISWAGFELMSFNFIFDTTTPQKRATCVAYYNVLNGLMIFIGAMIGTLAIKYNTTGILGSIYLPVFALSCIFRYAASIYFIPKLREVRHVAHISYEKLFMHIMTAMPTMGLMHRMILFEMRGIDHIGHRVKDGIKKFKDGKFRI